MDFGAIVSAIWLLIVLLPVEGFHETETDTLEIMKLKMSTKERTYYLWRLKNNKILFVYDNSEEYGLGDGAYQKDSVYGSSDVKIYESEECVTPILKIFKTKSKISWYSLAGMWDETEYVFYIPVGAIYREE